MQPQAVVEGVVQVCRLHDETDTRHCLDVGTQIHRVGNLLVAIAAIGHRRYVRCHGATLPHGLRLGARRVAQHHQHIVGTIRHEVVAQRQTAHHDGVE